GTTLAVGGQVEFMAGNAGNTYFSNGGQDATTRDRARVNLAGRTQLTNGIAGYGFMEWEANHAGSSSEATAINARFAYLGADFGKFGKVQVGRYVDPFEYASNLVDVLDEVGVYGGQDERNSGHISYMWSGFGFDAGISYQMAEDNYKSDILGNNTNFNVDSGFSIYAGYTSPVVLFGPISVRAGYLYLNGQSEKDGGNKAGYGLNEDKDGYESNLIDNMKSIDGAIAWGTNGKGFYIATNYNYSKFKSSKEYSWKLNGDLDSADDQDWNLKQKAWETVVTYGFANGVRLGASYHYIKTQDVYNGEKESGDTKFVQLIADYNVTPNFKVWAEGLIDAGSDDGYPKISSKLDSKNSGHNSIMFGARYVF
ncbi:MAG TPA: hypothetical protein DCL74_03385, partial [Succinivibrionaceae bacterium]|nr:hypothetical protein [Succinivibrionaceae bacterium]